jgi:putative endonuclease
VEPLPEGPVVYLLRCRDGSLYTGWTNHLPRRLRAHRAGKGARYTRSRLPVELVLAMRQPDAGSARREEARIKRLPLAAKLALIDAVPTEPGVGEKRDRSGRRGGRAQRSQAAEPPHGSDDG